MKSSSLRESKSRWFFALSRSVVDHGGYENLILHDFEWKKNCVSAPKFWVPEMNSEFDELDPILTQNAIIFEKNSVNDLSSSKSTREAWVGLKFVLLWGFPEVWFPSMMSPAGAFGYIFGWCALLNKKACQARWDRFQQIYQAGAVTVVRKFFLLIMSPPSERNLVE